MNPESDQRMAFQIVCQDYGDEFGILFDTHCKLIEKIILEKVANFHEVYKSNYLKHYDAVAPLVNPDNESKMYSQLKNELMSANDTELLEISKRELNNIILQSFNARLNIPLSICMEPIILNLILFFGDDEETIECFLEELDIMIRNLTTTLVYKRVLLPKVMNQSKPKKPSIKLIYD